MKDTTTLANYYYETMRNKAKYSDLDQKLTFLDVEYWFDRWNEIGLAHIFIVDKDDNILATIGEDFEHIYNTDLELMKNNLIKVVASDNFTGELRQYSKLFKYWADDDRFIEAK